MSSSSLQDLQKQIESLQHHLRETQENNHQLQQKLSDRRNSGDKISELQRQVSESNDYVKLLEDKLRSVQTSSLQQVLDSQKAEISGLRKKLTETQNCCAKVDGWLDEVGVFLSGLTDHTDNDVSSTSDVKQKVQQSLTVVRSLSSVLGKSDSVRNTRLVSCYLASSFVKKIVMYICFFVSLVKLRFMILKGYYSKS